MGRPKEGVVLPDGRRMIEPALASLAALCRRVVIVGACRGFSAPSEAGIIHLADRTPGRGPLAAVESLLLSGLDDGYLVVACDQPLLTPSLLALLVKGNPTQPTFFRSEEGEALDPFPGYFPVSWLPDVQTALQQGERSLRRLIQRSEAAWIPLPNPLLASLKNINTPADLEAL
jgi:molybdopterin-guanine dinucleotide biosynthesis protein A